MSKYLNTFHGSVSHSQREMLGSCGGKEKGRLDEMGFYNVS